ncbi:MAG: hypothetical protein VB913_17295 [Rhodospirillales bacterium]
MFDGPKSLNRIFETNTQSVLSEIGIPAQNAGFLDDNEAYQQLKKDAMENILKSAPKGLRKRLAAMEC